MDGQLNRVEVWGEFFIESIDWAGDDVFLVEILLSDVGIVQESEFLRFA